MPTILTITVISRFVFFYEITLMNMNQQTIRYWTKNINSYWLKPVLQPLEVKSKNLTF